ncbi:hypothetical protein QBC39DRAFT_397610 [Podospora conica]|nr:hypothetical protein QBC39DRAFT_397610 [Schizothecium conicum]
MPRFQRPIESRVRAAAKHGIARWELARIVWEDWPKGFLSPDWDGATFDEESARKLLDGMRGEETHIEQQTGDKGQQPGEPDDRTPELTVISEQCRFDPPAGAAPAPPEHPAAAPTPPEHPTPAPAPPEPPAAVTPRSFIFPADTASRVGARPTPARPRPRRFSAVAERDDDDNDDAAFLESRRSTSLK